MTIEMCYRLIMKKSKLTEVNDAGPNDPLVYLWLQIWLIENFANHCIGFSQHICSRVTNMVSRATTFVQGYKYGDSNHHICAQLQKWWLIRYLFIGEQIKGVNKYGPNSAHETGAVKIRDMFRFRDSHADRPIQRGAPGPLNPHSLQGLSQHRHFFGYIKP